MAMRQEGYMIGTRMRRCLFEIPEEVPDDQAFVERFGQAFGIEFPEGGGECFFRKIQTKLPENLGDVVDASVWKRFPALCPSGGLPAWCIEKDRSAIEAYSGLTDLQALNLHPSGIKRPAGMDTVQWLRKNTLLEQLIESLAGQAEHLSQFRD